MNLSMVSILVLSILSLTLSSYFDFKYGDELMSNDEIPISNVEFRCRDIYNF